MGAGCSSVLAGVCPCFPPHPTPLQEMPSGRSNRNHGAAQIWLKSPWWVRSTPWWGTCQMRTDEH